MVDTSRELAMGGEKDAAVNAIGLLVLAMVFTDGRDLNLMPTTEEHSGLNSTTTTLLAEIAASERMDVLDQATLLGVELLRGGKPNLVQKS